jgi:hypothetical protein
VDVGAGQLIVAKPVALLNTTLTLEGGPGTFKGVIPPGILDDPELGPPFAITLGI